MKPTCAVPSCTNPATVAVLLYDVYPDGIVFWEQDHTCSHLCSKHLIENESGAKGVRISRGNVSYPHTNQEEAQGFSIYRPLES